MPHSAACVELPAQGKKGVMKRPQRTKIRIQQDIKIRRAKIQATGFGFRVTGVLADRYIKPIF